ncbi:MAG: ATP-binding protein [bacterium]
MHKKRLLWRLFPSYLLITMVSLLCITFYFSEFQKSFYLKNLSDELKIKASMLSERFSLNSENSSIQESVKKISALSSMRITFIDIKGNVVAESSKIHKKLENHLKRPEIQSAIKGKVFVTKRYSHTTGQEMLYAAAPVIKQGHIIGAIRVSIPLKPINIALINIYENIAVVGLLISIFAAFLSHYVSKRLSSPIEKLEEGAMNFAKGELNHRLTVPGYREITGLAEAMNQMASQLDERIRMITEQKNEQEAVFSSMVEGVIAVDIDECIIHMNQAAAKLIGISAEEAEGCKIHEIIQNTDLQYLIDKALTGLKSVEGDITLVYNNDKKHIQVNSTVWRDSKGNSIGAVVVLNDVTRLRKLENMRKEFVANVSHELKTPITSIKGFVETLLDGAIDDREDAERFLHIIKKHADRLTAIIEDLLSISRLEQESGTAEIYLEETKICEVLKSAVCACLPKAESKGVNIKIECNSELSANLNNSLLEQAIVNLIDNAIKYSETKKDVLVSVNKHENKLSVEVRDYGVGIPEEHLSRLFERFYRVDKARSRKMGGTGLGLSIVKHIAGLHGGGVDVKSEIGKGSSFFIYLPSIQN